MAATIGFYAGENFTINALSGSGIGFYGDSGFGYSVAVGDYQGRSFITDSTGTSEGPEIDNCKYVSLSGVLHGQSGSGYLLTQLPNYLATLNIRFTNDSAVQVQNARVYFGDRTSKNNTVAGMTMYGAEIIHTDLLSANNGSGDATWVTMAGSGSTLSLVDSPGISGTSVSGPATEETRHDWYVALSATHSTAGAKEGRFYVELEYL